MENNDSKILIIEDEPKIVDILAFNLRREGYAVTSALDGLSGLELALGGEYGLVLLDVMLPEMDGFEVLRRVRKAGIVTPIIMLTAREEEADKILGLETGADDYITKPFSMRELVARVKANTRRKKMDGMERHAPDSSLISAGELKIDHARVEVFKRGQQIDLTQREYDLLFFLASQPEKVFTREELMEKVWNYEYYGDLRTVDVTVRRLREKIETNPAQPEYILTKRGVGYLFCRY